MGKEYRVNQIITLLKKEQENGGLSIKELARELDVTERTVYSTLNYIENEMALPLQRPGRVSRMNNGKYRLNIDTNYDEPLDRDLDSLMTRKSLWSDDEFSNSNRQFFHLTHRTGSGKTGTLLMAMEGKIKVRDYELVNDKDNKDTKYNVLKSLMNNYELEITYTAFYRNREVTRRTIHPYGLVRLGATWYAVAYCLLRQSIRTFKLDRIVRSQVLNTTFDVPQEFNLDNYLAHSWGIIVEPDQKPQEVKLLFSPKIANEVIKYKYHPSQRNRWVDNGWLEVSFGIASVTEMKNWILSWGADVLVLEPENLREELVQLLKVCLKNLEVSP